MSDAKPQVGDEHELFLRYDSTLVQRTKRVTQITAEDAEDAVAFAWIQLLRKQPDRGGNVLAWLTVVARNRAIDLRQERLSKRTVDIVDTAMFVHDPRDLVDARNAVLDAQSSLSEIPETERKALVMRGVGFSKQEIAKELGTTLAYEGRLESKGLDRMRSKQMELEEEGPDAPPRLRLLAELRRDPPEFLRLEIGGCPKHSNRSDVTERRLRWSALALRIIDHRVEQGISDPRRALGDIGEHPRDERRADLERDISHFQLGRQIETSRTEKDRSALGDQGASVPWSPLLDDLRRDPPQFLRLEIGRCPSGDGRSDIDQQQRWSALAARIIDHRAERGISDAALALGSIRDHPRDEVRVALERDISEYQLNRQAKRDRGLER
jgi:RNA polymerase sigma factor (sigma-70 family)